MRLLSAPNPSVLTLCGEAERESPCVAPRGQQSPRDARCRQAGRVMEDGPAFGVGSAPGSSRPGTAAPDLGRMRPALAEQPAAEESRPRMPREFSKSSSSPPTREGERRRGSSASARRGCLGDTAWFAAGSGRGGPSSTGPPSATLGAAAAGLLAVSTAGRSEGTASGGRVRALGE